MLYEVITSFSLGDGNLESLTRVDGNSQLFSETLYSGRYSSSTLGGTGGRVTISTQQDLIHDDASDAPLDGHAEFHAELPGDGLGLIPDRPDASAILTLALRDPGVDLTRGGKPQQPPASCRITSYNVCYTKLLRTFADVIDHEKCIGCGRCFKACSRKVLGPEDLVDEETDSTRMVMTIVNRNNFV